MTVHLQEYIMGAPRARCGAHRNVQHPTWVLDPAHVTCPKCRALMASDSIKALSKSDDDEGCDWSKVTR